MNKQEESPEFKVGDEVVPQAFSNPSYLQCVQNEMKTYIGKKGIIGGFNHGKTLALVHGWWWPLSALTSVETETVEGETVEDEPILWAAKDMLSWCLKNVNAAHFPEYDHLSKAIDNYQEQAAKLSQLEAENTELREAQRWIPVSERLPKHSNIVLVVSEGGSPYIAWYNTIYKYWSVPSVVIKWKEIKTF